jgi:hypothetical protein
MSESNSTDHWSQLASEIGAEPVEPPPAEPAPLSPPQEREREAFSAVVPAPVSPKPSAAPSGTPRVRSGPGWDALAKEFGIEAPPEPPKTTVEETAVEAAVFAEEAPPGEVLDEETPSSEAIDFLSRDEAEALLFGGKGPPPRSPAIPEAPPAEEHKRRRRKRRDRNRPAKTSAQSQDVSEEGPPEGAPPPWRTDRDFGAENLVAADDSPDLLFDEDVEERPPEGLAEPLPRHRGRRDERKKKRRRKADGGPSGKSRPDETAASETGFLEDAIETFEAKHTAADREDEEEEEDAQGRKSGLRSIPTWSEAIGVIVAKNMESRGKRSFEGHPPRGAPDSRRRRR